MLPEAVAAEFAARGFVRIEGFLDSSEVDATNRRVDRLIAQTVPGLPRELVYYEDKADTKTLKQIQRLFEHDDGFAAMMFGSRFEALAAALLAEPVIGKNLQFFDKPPGTSRATPPHQDGFYFMLNPCRALTMWLALEDVGEDQGCVRYVSGSHRRGLRPHGESSVLGFSQRILDYGTPMDLANEISVPVRAGDLIVHDARTIHFAGENATTDRSRRALGFIYYGASAREDVEAHAAYQSRLAANLARLDRI